MKSELGVKLTHSWSFEDTVTFNYKIDSHVKWKFFSQHLSLSLIWYCRQHRSEQSYTDFCRTDYWFSVWHLRKMINFPSISCRFCWCNELQNSREIEKVFKIVYCSMIHCHACVAMNLALKHGFLSIFKTRFTESRSQISHYFGGIHHVPQWSISQIVVRCQHYTC